MRKLWRKSSFILVLLLGVVLLTPTVRAGSDQMGYHDGFFMRSADDDFLLKFRGLFKAFYNFGIFDGAQNTSSYDIGIARLYWKGHAFGPEWTYKFSLENAAAAGGVALLDYYVNYEYNDMFNIRVGNFKVPYSREFMTFNGHLQFANRALTGPAVAPAAFVATVPGREIGVSVWGAIADGMVDYYLAMTNGFVNGTGSGVNQGTLTAGPASTDIDFRYTARAVLHLMGSHGYWYSDMGMSDEMQLAVSGGFNYNKIDNDADGLFDDNFGITGDVIFAMNGFSASGEFHYTKTDGSAVADTDAITLLGTLGYFLTEDVEVAGRFLYQDPDNAVSSTLIAPGGVINYYFSGHNAKLQLQYDLTKQDDFPAAGTNLTNHSGIVQVQFLI